MDLDYIHKIINIIETHGLSLVLLILLIVTFFIPWVRRLQKFYDSSKGGNEESEFIDEIIDLESGIMETLGQVAVDMDSQWATLWQFHNGISSVDGVPFVKMSITHEFTSGTVTPRFELYQGVPISVFIDAITDVRVNGYLEVDTKSQYKSLVNSYKRDGIGSAVLVPVRNQAGKMIGLLSAAYAKGKRPHHSEASRHVIIDNAASVSIQLGQLASFRKRLNRRKGDSTK